MKPSDSAFLRACARQPTDFTPVWLMRQAGRFMPEYNAVRKKLGFMGLCKNPEAAAEVTVMAVEKLGVDAAIIFSDILLILQPMGVSLSYGGGKGPKIAQPVRSARQIDELREVDPAESLSFVFEAIKLARAALDGRVPLIGFSGAPFTLASYLIEGGGSRQYLATKELMHRDPGAWNALMERLSAVVAQYLKCQIDAGAQAVQLFDSWVGCLSFEDYRLYVMPYMRAAISAISGRVPVIHFGTATAGILELMAEAGGDVIGVDWRVHLGRAWERLGFRVAIQGNLDPAALLFDRATVNRGVEAVLEAAGGRPGHVFNLGHGVLPETPVDNVRFLVDRVHELSARR